MSIIGTFRRRRLRAALATAFALACAAGAPGAVFAHGGEDDGHGGHGGSTKPLPADVDRCDLGFNTQGYNDAIKAGKQHDLSPTWAEQFLPYEPSFYKMSFWDKLAYNAASFINHDVYRGMAATGHIGHPLVDPWQGMTDPVQCDHLKTQLREVMLAVRKFPTLGAAQKGGYGMRTPYFAGSGAHVVLKGIEDDQDYEAQPSVPPSLLYDGMGPNAAVVGAMFGYETTRDMNTQIFDTPNGSWHQHKGLCYVKSPVLGWIYPNATRIVLGSEATSDESCKKRGGYKDEASALYMMHVWVVPGCENPLGLFAHDNPRLTTTLNVRSGRSGNRGCGTGKSVHDPLTMQTNELNVAGQLTSYRSSSFSWSEQGSTASGPVAAKLADHPGSAHADGESHLSGSLVTEQGFSGPAGSWPVSILRELTGEIHGTVTTPNGTVATVDAFAAERTDKGVKITGTGKTPAGAAVQLSVEIANPGLRDWFLAPPASEAETLAIHHPAHGHDHAAGPVAYALAAHPGENHVGEEHLFGTAVTKAGFTGDAGSWTVSFTKNTATKAIKGYLKDPAAAKTFNFVVSDHHDSEECAGGVHVNATGSEAATPTDPQNPEFVICDPAVTAFFADHDHGQHGDNPTTPTPTTPASTTPHEHTH